MQVEGVEVETRRRSRSGIKFFYGKAPIYISSCNRNDSALSSNETEYMVLSSTARIAKWLRQVCAKLDIWQGATPIYQEDVGCTKWSERGHSRQFTRHKHIYIRSNVVPNMVADDTVCILKVHKADMLADFLTKPLGNLSFFSPFKQWKCFSRIQYITASHFRSCTSCPFCATSLFPASVQGGVLRYGDIRWHRLMLHRGKWCHGNKFV